MRRALVILAVAVLVTLTGCASVNHLGASSLAWQATNWTHRPLRGQAPEQLDGDRRACADESADVGKRMADWRTWVVPGGAYASDLDRYRACMTARGYEVDTTPIDKPKADGPPR